MTTNEFDVEMDRYGLIRLGGRIIGLLVPSDYGTYLCPPIVFDIDGKMVMGNELFTLSQVPPPGFPTLTGLTTADVAAFKRRLWAVADYLGVPVGTPR